MVDVLPLPALLTEAEAARALGVSVDTLRRERRRRRIGYTAIAGRPRYTDKHLADYVAANEVAPCQRDGVTSTPGSVDIGSVAGPTVASGAAHGSTPRPDRLAEHHSALMILQPQSKHLRNGSPATLRPTAQIPEALRSPVSSSATTRRTDGT